MSFAELRMLFSCCGTSACIVAAAIVLAAQAEDRGKQDVKSLIPAFTVAVWAAGEVFGSLFLPAEELSRCGES